MWNEYYCGVLLLILLTAHSEQGLAPRFLQRLLALSVYRCLTGASISWKIKLDRSWNELAYEWKVDALTLCVALIVDILGQTTPRPIKVHQYLFLLLKRVVSWVIVSTGGVPDVDLH